MKLDLGPKAVACLRIAEANTLHPDEYARRQQAAFRAWKEKPVLTKCEELRQRGYLVRAEGFMAFDLTPKGRTALIAHMAEDQKSYCLPEDSLAQALTHLDTVYPEEGVGVILARDGVREHVALENIQSTLNRLDPDKFPQTGATAYAIHPDEAREIFRRRQEGWRLEVLYHSHVETLPVFSAEDEARALVDGQPLFPEAVYLIAARSREVGGSNAVAAYRWSPRAGEYIGVQLAIEKVIVGA